MRDASRGCNQSCNIMSADIEPASANVNLKWAQSSDRLRSYFVRAQQLSKGNASITKSSTNSMCNTASSVILNTCGVNVQQENNLDPSNCKRDQVGRPLGLTRLCDLSIPTWWEESRRLAVFCNCSWHSWVFWVFVTHLCYAIHSLIENGSIPRGWCGLDWTVTVST